MTRLNRSIKDKIIAAAIDKSGANDRTAKLVERRAQFAEDVRVFSMGGAEKVAQIIKVNDKVNKILKTMPKPYNNSTRTLTQECRLYCNIAGMAINAYFNGHHQYRGMKNVYKMTLESSCVIKSDNPLCAEFHEIEKEAKTIKGLIESVKVNVGGAIEGVTTVKKLLQVWPESKELLPTDTDEVKPQLPAVRVSQLNAMIGLPSEAV